MQGGLPNNVPAGGNTGITLNGYPTYECSGVTSTLASSNLILVIGDFSRYYCIVDRMGLDVEVIPHLFGGTNRYPTGQRGIYAMWRNTAKVIDANGFRVLTLK
jgi:HK97 family phage major capsid protein